MHSCNLHPSIFQLKCRHDFPLVIASNFPTAQFLPPMPKSRPSAYPSIQHPLLPLFLFPFSLPGFVPFFASRPRLPPHPRSALSSFTPFLPSGELEPPHHSQGPGPPLGARGYLPGCYAGEELGRHSRSQAQTHKHSLAIPNRTPSASASEVDSAETRDHRAGPSFSSSRLCPLPGPASSAHLPQPRLRHASNRQESIPVGWAWPQPGIETPWCHFPGDPVGGRGFRAAVIQSPIPTAERLVCHLQARERGALGLHHPELCNNLEHHGMPPASAGSPRGFGAAECKGWNSYTSRSCHHVCLGL